MIKITKSVLYSLFLLISFTLTSQNLLTYEYELSDIIYSDKSDRIYGLKSSQKFNGSSILVISPKTGEIINTIQLGAEPVNMCLSENKNYLYISYYGQNKIDRLRLSDFYLETILILTNPNNINDQGFRGYGISATPVFEDGVLITNMEYSYTLDRNENFVFDGEKVLDKKVEIREGYKYLQQVEGTNIIYGINNKSNKIGKLVIDEEGVEKVEEISLNYINPSDIPFHVFNSKIVFNNGKNYLINNGTLEVQDNLALSNNASFEYDYSNDKLFGFGSGNLPANEMFLISFTGDSLKVIDTYPLTDIRMYPEKLIKTGASNRFAVISSFGDLSIINLDCNNQVSDTINVSIEFNSSCVGDSIKVTTNEIFPLYAWDISGRNFNTPQFETNIIHTSFEINLSAYDLNGCLMGYEKNTNFKGRSKPERPTDKNLWQNVLCKNDSLKLEVRPESENLGYIEWDNGKIGKSIWVNEEGVYRARHVIDGCGSDYVSIPVVQHSHSSLKKAALSHMDTIYRCYDDPLIVSAIDSSYSYYWGDEFSENKASILIEEDANISLRYVDEFGCKGPGSDSLFVRFHPIAFTYSEMDYSDYYLTNTKIGNYEWYRNGELMPDDTSNSLFIVKPGLYYSRLKSDEGCYSYFTNPRYISYGFQGEPTVLEGVFYFDQNQDYKLSQGEIGVGPIGIRREPGRIMTYSDENGNFSFDLPEGYYELYPEIDTSIWEVYEGKGGQIANLLDSTYIRANFGIYPKNESLTLQQSVKTSIIRCTRNVRGWVELMNISIPSFTGDFCIKVDPAIESAFINGVNFASTGGEYCWSIQDLKIGESFKDKFNFIAPNFEFIDSTLTFKTYSKQNNEILFESEFSDIVRCSYDPNDKLVSPQRGNEGQYALFEDTIQYTIRFQNTGNDTAFTVRLVDKLSYDLDWKTFTPIGASHHHQINFNLNNGDLEVIFDDILLPDSLTNEVESQGFFTFSILPLGDLGEATEITNKAQIYFDFNPPILTNETKSVLVSEVPIESSTKDDIHDTLNFSVHPNPSSDRFTVSFPTIKKGYKLIIADITGKIFWSGTAKARMEFSVNEYESGVYLIQLQNEYGKTTQSEKLIITK